jgi:hypothetical protein
MKYKPGRAIAMNVEQVVKPMQAKPEIPKASLRDFLSFLSFVVSVITCLLTILWTYLMFEIITYSGPVPKSRGHPDGSLLIFASALWLAGPALVTFLLTGAFYLYRRERRDLWSLSISGLTACVVVVTVACFVSKARY